MIGKILLLLLIGLGICFIINIDMEEKIEEQQYHGPVPNGYDLEHFRKIGETIQEENK